MISSGKATLVELNTVLGLEDVYDILEVEAVDARNRAFVIEQSKGNKGR